MYYHYDENGELVGFNYDENEYFYYRDLTGNIIKIVDSYGSTKVEYKYDAWGKILDVTGDSTIIAVNSFLYKGYYYDSEISMYYCKSRYYDPSIGRWISIDDSTYLDPKTINGINLWSYCGNNPVMGYDPEGTWNWNKFWKSLTKPAVVVAVVAIVVVATVVTGGVGTALIYGAAAVAGAVAGAAIVAEFQDPHYDRNENQEEFIEGKDIKYFLENWDDLDIKQNIYHRHKKGSQGDDAEYNVKYVDPTGHMEVIICQIPGVDDKDISNYYIVTDPYNCGTYNNCSPTANPIGHFFADVLPYWLWGNSPEDSGIEHMFWRIFGAKR